MNFVSQNVVTVMYAAPILTAAAWDAVWYRIPNVLSALLVVLFLAVAFGSGVPINWISHLGAGLLVLAVGLVLFALRVFGGGDAKLLAAAALWLGWNNLLLFVVLVGLAGGVLAVGLVVVRQALQRWSLPVRVPRIFSPGEPVPYGLAIAAAALYLAPEAARLTWVG